MNNDEIRNALAQALTTYDRKQSERAARSRRGYHNSHALGIYLARVDDIIRDIEHGATPTEAICAGFTGTLQSTCLKAIKSKPVDLPENGAWHYVPASERKTSEP